MRALRTLTILDMALINRGREIHRASIVPGTFEQVASVIHKSFERYSEGNRFTSGQLNESDPRTWTASRVLEASASGQPEFSMHVTLEPTMVDERSRVRVDATISSKPRSQFERDVLSGAWLSGLTTTVLDRQDSSLDL